LLQDYPGKRLLILNDAPVPIRAGYCPRDVTVINCRPRFATLGHKRQALLELADTPLVAHWDDDDLYLPWHLDRCVNRLTGRPGAGCVKPGRAWFGVGARDAMHIRGLRRNVFEGQMVFERRRALALGGYPPLVSGQAKALLEAFRRAGELHVWDPEPEEISYVYRWGEGQKHISAGADSLRSHAAFGRGNRDFGNGAPLIPKRDAHAWARQRLGAHSPGAMSLAATVAMALAGVRSTTAR
jgi:hypothetical protein